MARRAVAGQTRFTTGDIARLISASRNTVVRYIEEGRLRARRTVGGWYVVDRVELVDFVWDLSFSKGTPLKVWRAASLAYEQFAREDEAAPAEAPTAPKAGPHAAPRRRRAR
ncbi:MAG TPA: helix-turn-helix domain-containing protein [Planctomycetota bacterium]|nr:helix-turn-helix domain-containing protein [Planctomycetota bacterium]